MKTTSRFIAIALVAAAAATALTSTPAYAQLIAFESGEATNAGEVNDNFAYLEDLAFELRADLESVQEALEENRDVFGRSYRVYTGSRIIEGEDTEFVDTLIGATFVIGFDTDTIGMASISGVSQEKEVVLINEIFNEGEADEFEAAGPTEISESSTEELEGEEALLVPYEQDSETGIITIEDIPGFFSVSKMGDVLMGGIRDSEEEMLEVGLRVGVEISQTVLPEL